MRRALYPYGFEKDDNVNENNGKLLRFNGIRIR